MPNNNKTITMPPSSKPKSKSAALLAASHAVINDELVHLQSKMRLRANMSISERASAIKSGADSLVAIEDALFFTPPPPNSVFPNSHLSPIPPYLKTAAYFYSDRSDRSDRSAQNQNPTTSSSSPHLPPPPLYLLYPIPSHTYSHPSHVLNLSFWSNLDDDSLIDTVKDNEYRELICCDNPNLTDGKLRILQIAASNFLTSLVLRNNPNITFSNLQLSARHLLLHLDVSSNTNLNDESLICIVKAVSSTLSILNISSCHAVTDASISTLTNCADLTSLSASHLTTLSDRSIQLLLKSCKKLTTLMISSCKNFTGKCFKAMVPGMAVANIYGLKVLDVSFCKSLDEGTVHFIGAGLIHLESVNISHIGHFKCSELESLSSATGETLTSLDASGWVGVEDETPNYLSRKDATAPEQQQDDGSSVATKTSRTVANKTAAAIHHLPHIMIPETILVVANNLAYLTYLNLKPSRPTNALPAKCFFHLFSKIYSLTYIDLSGNTCINEQSFGGASTSLSHASLLTLKLDNCPAVNNLCLEAIGHSFPKLQVLSLPDSELINYNQHNFSSWNLFTELREVDFSSSWKINDDFVFDMVVSNPGLEVIRIGKEKTKYSCEITTKAFVYIAVNCPRIKELSLVNSATLGSFQNAGYAPPDPSSMSLLTKLNLSHNKNLTPVTLFNITTAAPNLLSLDVKSCPLVQQSAKISDTILQKFNYIAISKPPFSGFEPVSDYEGMYYRDACLGRIALERDASNLITKNYKAYKMNAIWRVWLSAKKIMRAVRAYKFRKSNKDYAAFKLKAKVRKAREKAKRKEAFVRTFSKVRGAAVDIQRVYRGHDGRCTVNFMLDQIAAAVSIQTNWRGLVVKMKDLLWVLRKEKELKVLTTLIESGVFLPNPKEPFGVDPAIRTQIASVRQDVNEMLSHPVPLTANGNKNPQPRRFDEEPYVSLPFDRRLPIYGGKPSDDYKVDLTSKGAHVFGGHLWPRPAKTKKESLSESFDPKKTFYQNLSAQIDAEHDTTHDPYNPVIRREPHPKCSLCNLRYMALACLQCHTAYCVTCSAHVHGKPTKQHHTVKQYHHNPEIKQRVVGLVPHITAAAAASKKALAVTTMAQNNAELRRIEEAKELDKQMEAEELAAIQAAKAAALVSQEIHDAAKTLQEFQRNVVHKTKVQEGMLKLRDLVVGHDIVLHEQTFWTTKIQVAFRGFSARNYLATRGVKLAPGIPPLEFRRIAAERVSVDFANRRLYERQFQIHQLEEVKLSLSKRTADESQWAIAECIKYEQLSEKSKQWAVKTLAAENKCREETAKFDIKSDEYYAGSVKMKVFNAQKTRAMNNKELSDAALRWTTMHYRQTARRAAQSNIQSGEAAKHLKWIDDESVVLRELMAFVKVRDDRLEDCNENKYYKEWLKDQHERILHRLVAYDTDQESTLETNLHRLQREIDSGKNDRASVIEILTVLLRDRQYDAEKVGAEISRLSCASHSDEGLIHLVRATALKKKQQHLKEEILPEIASGLMTAHTQEDALVERIVTFKGDENGLTRLTMNLLRAVLKVSPKSRRTFSNEKWMDLFRSQPWLSRQNAEEGRLEDIRKENRAELEKKMLHFAKQRKEVEKGKAEVKAVENKIVELYRRSKSGEIASELDKQDLILEAESLRAAIIKDATEKLRREEALKKDEDKNAERLSVIEAEEAEANSRLNKQMHAIEMFQQEELKEDELVAQEIEDEKKAAVLLEKERLSRLGVDGEVDLVDEVEEEEKKLRNAALAEKERKLQATRERREQFQKNAEAEAKEELDKKQMKIQQEDIRLRKIAVYKAQRELTDQVEKERLEVVKAEDVRKKANWQADQADRDILSLGINGISSTGAKQAKTRLKQFLRKTAGTRDDPEKIQMISTIKKRMKIKSGQVEAIRFIKFTVGTEETDKFTAKQAKLQSTGMPFFRRVLREIGLHEQIVIWVEKTVDQDEFITDIELSHTDTENEFFVDLSDEGWDKSSHLKMQGVSLNEPSFAVWFKKDAKKLPISDLNLSYSLTDEEELSKEGFVMLEANLHNFGFGSMNLWVRTTLRSAVLVLASSGQVAIQLADCRQMLSKNPDDVKIQEMEEKLIRKLHDAQIQEDESREKNENPIKYTMEFLALTPVELEKLIEYFSQIDSDLDGFAYMEEWCEFVGEDMSVFVEHLFKLTNSLDEFERLDFGECMKATSTFCMLDGEEIIRLLYSMYDPEGDGYISNARFLDMLSVLHPTRDERGATKRAMKEFDLPKTDKITFATVVDLNSKFPNMFYPALRLQFHTREAFFGNRWWESKLKKYMAVKEQLVKKHITSQQVDGKTEQRNVRNAKKMERKKKRVELARENKSKFVSFLFIGTNLTDFLIPDIDYKGKSVNPFTRQAEKQEEQRRMLEERVKDGGEEGQEE